MLMQMMSEPRLQKARGQVRICFDVRHGRTRLADLYMDGSAKALLPRTHGTEPQAVIINTAGGLTGGDAFDYSVELGAGARATVSTQTAERAYRAAAGTARIKTRLHLGPGACLDWLPQETILFEGSAVARRIEADVAPGACLLMVEALTLGRAAMGETLDAVSFSDQWRVRQNGTLVHAEAARIEAPLAELRTPAALGSARALATVLYVAPDAEDQLVAVRAFPGFDGVRHAASAWGGRLVIRYLADAAQPLRTALIDHLTRMRGAPMPRVWTM